MNETEAQINDRITRLAARVALLDGRSEDPLHPAVAQAPGSAEIVKHAYSQLPVTAPGRALIDAHGITEVQSVSDGKRTSSREVPLRSSEAAAALADRERAGGLNGVAIIDPSS